MIYSFNAPREIINDHLTVLSENELAFVYVTAALSEKADLKIKSINSDLLAAVYDDAGIQSNYYDDTLYISTKPLNINGTLVKDFSGYAQYAIPYAIVCAAKGIQADLKGLEYFSKEKGAEEISKFQKEIYRFNINTDFCDHSKLKIYNNKTIQLKSKPVNVAPVHSLSINFIPLAVTFGKIEIEMTADYFEINPEIILLLKSLNFSFTKKDSISEKK